MQGTQQTWILRAGALCLVLLFVTLYSISGGSESNMDNELLRKKLKQLEVQQKMNGLLEEKSKMLNEKAAALPNAGTFSPEVILKLNQQLENKEKEIQLLNEELNQLKEVDDQNYEYINEQKDLISEKEQRIEELEDVLNDNANNADENDQLMKDEVAKLLAQIEKKFEKDAFRNVKFIKVVHYVHPFNVAFDWMAYISVKSALKKISPDQVIIHYEEMPSGPLYDKLRKEFPNIATEPIEGEDSDPNGVIGGGDLTRHNTLKLEILYQQGGIVADYSNVILKSFDEFVKTEASIIAGEKANGDVGLDLIMSKQKHPVWGEFLDFQKTNGSLKLSSRIFTHLLKLYSNQDKSKSDIEVIPTGNFYSIDRLKFQKILAGEEVSLSNSSHVLHIYKPEEIKIDDIRNKKNSVLAELASYLTEEDYDIIERQ